MQGIEHATFTISLKANLSVLFEEVYMGSSDASANCNYIFPSASNHCSGL